MKKSLLFFIAISIFILMISTGCSGSGNKNAIISIHSDSNYTNTFEDLGLGILYDFHFKLPNADERRVYVWVEHYENGEKEPQHVTELSYGLSPEEVEEGHLGFGMINPNSDDALFILYAPGVTQKPKRAEKNIPASDGISTWDYAIGDGDVEIPLGETRLLGVYRQSSGNSMKTYDFQDKDDVKRMINDDTTVLLLKIRVVEEKQKSELFNS